LLHLGVRLGVRLHLGLGLGLLRAAQQDLPLHRSDTRFREFHQPAQPGRVVSRLLHELLDLLLELGVGRADR
jgi:hypothetical protein